MEFPTHGKRPALCPLPAASWAISLAVYKGLHLPFPQQCNMPLVSHHKMGGSNPFRADSLRAQRRCTLATSSIEACGGTWQRGFAQKIPRRAIKAFSIPRRRHECRARREQVCICCHFHQEAQQCCNSTAQRPCLGFFCQAPPPHTSFFGVRALSCPRRIGTSRESYF